MDGNGLIYRARETTAAAGISRTDRMLKRLPRLAIVGGEAYAVATRLPLQFLWRAG